MKEIVVGLAVVSAAILSAPIADAGPGGDQADLSQPFSSAGGPFIGSWSAHGEGVDINADGSGVEHYRGGTMTFQLSEVQDSGQTAYGNVVSGGNAGPGAWVTVHLVDGGNGMQFSSAGGDQSFPFCKVVGGQRVNSADCGA